MDGAQIRPNQRVLDLMCGNGNLSKSLIERHHGIKDSLEIHGIDISEVQIRIGASLLGDEPGIFLRAGDAAEMAYPNHYFDSILRKSSSHEVRPPLQRKILDEAYRTLKPSGRFVDLTMLFDDVAERNDFYELTSLKDLMGGLHDLFENRHFYMHSEYFPMLRDVGFRDIEVLREFNYKIDLEYALSVYFKGDERKFDHFHECARSLDSLVDGKIYYICEEGRHFLMPPANIVRMRKSGVE
uniref:Ubiquinone/menaquinone biosynthesis C-methylase UbiE n=1 Tax=Candidatus Kentrum sp. LFY TaxID=2126342 RepID=A0A450V9C7_9GAMM|nr:MAG: Ubiquinone/menaquinone biosynthesis C-methylase UbiE [Candidatus Kentron sp. LFY]